MVQSNIHSQPDHQGRLTGEEYIQFEDEIYKIFNLIDKEKVGHLSVVDVLAFQEDTRQILQEVGAELGQADKNQVIAAFITGAVSEQDHAAKSNGTLITWHAFFETLRQWILIHSEVLIDVMETQGGKLTVQDRQVLYEYIQAFFIQGDKGVLNKLLQTCHDSCENLESDLKSRKIDMTEYHQFGGQFDSQEEYVQKLALSKMVIDNENIRILFSQQDIETDTLASDGIQELVNLYQIFSCFDGSQRHLLRENAEHVRKIVDFTIQLKMIDRFLMYLSQADFSLSLNESFRMRCNILICLNYITYGYGFFSQQNGLQSFSRTNGSKIDTQARAADHSRARQIHDSLFQTELIKQIFTQCSLDYQPCSEIREMAFLLIGNYLKQDIDILGCWHNEENLNAIYSSLLNLDTKQPANTMFYAMWSLYMYSSAQSRHGAQPNPNMLQILQFVAQLVKTFVFDQEQFQSQNHQTLINEEKQQFYFMSSLIFANLLHFYKRDENNLAEQVLCGYIGQKIKEDNSEEVFKAFMLCFYKTIQNTKEHSSPQVLTQIKDTIVLLFRDPNVPEKLGVTAFLLLLELAKQGYYDLVMDAQIMNILLNQIQITNQKFSQKGINHLNCFHGITLDIFTVLIKANQTEKLTDQGLVRIVFQELKQFTSSNDQLFEYYFKSNGPDKQLYKLNNDSDKDPAIRELKGIQIDYLYQLFKLANLMLENMRSADQTYKTFTRDCIDRIEPCLDIIVTMLNNQECREHTPLLRLLVEIKEFLHRYITKLDQSSAQKQISRQALDYSETEEFFLASKYNAWLEITYQTYINYEDFQDKVFQINCHYGNQVVSIDGPWNMTFDQLQARICHITNDDRIQMYYQVQVDENDTVIQIRDSKTKDEVFRLGVNKWLMGLSNEPLNLDLIVEGPKMTFVWNIPHNHIFEFQCYSCGGQFTRDRTTSYPMEDDELICLQCYREAFERSRRQIGENFI